MRCNFVVDIADVMFFKFFRWIKLRHFKTKWLAWYPPVFGDFRQVKYHGGSGLERREILKNNFRHTIENRMKARSGDSATLQKKLKQNQNNWRKFVTHLPYANLVKRKLEKNSSVHKVRTSDHQHFVNKYFLRFQKKLECQIACGWNGQSRDFDWGDKIRTCHES